MNMADYLHRDTQGPCPDGFHIPTKTDWENVVNAGVSLGRRTTTSGDGIKNYLKLPYCGEINGSSAAFSDKGSRGYYWMSTAYDNDAEGCYLLTGSSYVRADQKTYRTYGHSIRPFKNSSVVPDSTWTVIYQGTGNAGIFNNASLGLISISSDGVTWYTIADKNLGATTVYNNGDTLSEANCGNFYQRGNNYQFSWSTSPSVLYTTQTNASGYGPGNYYTNAGFIKRTSSPFGWDSSDNRNLRGGVTDTRPEPTLNKYITKLYHLGKEYIFDERVSPTGINVSPTSINLTKLNQTAQITASVIPTNADDKKIIYTSSAPSIVSVSSTGLVKALGEGNATITVKSNEGGFSKSVSVVSNFGWQPGSNTVAYYPLTSSTTTSDMSGNGKTLTNSGMTFDSISATSTGGTKYLYSPVSIPDNYYIGLWVSRSQFNSSGGGARVVAPDGARSIIIGFGDNSGLFVDNGSYDNTWAISFTTPLNQWFYVALTGNRSSATGYIISNGTVYKNTSTGQRARTGLVFGNNGSSSWRSDNDAFFGKFSNIIIESKTRTEAEITDYYNKTKSNYGK